MGGERACLHDHTIPWNFGQVEEFPMTVSHSWLQQPRLESNSGPDNAVFCIFNIYNIYIYILVHMHQCCVCVVTPKGLYLGSD